jgi:hypothetical protein
MPLILPGNVASATAGAFSVANSCRFNKPDSAYLVRTLGTPTDADKWSYSVWIKRTNLGANNYLIVAGSDGTNWTEINFNASDALRIADYQGAYTGQLITNRVFRDPAAWFHFLFVYDGSNATAGNRMRIYVNGTEETSFSTDSNPTSGQAFKMNSAVSHTIGSSVAEGGTVDFDGYMAEVCFIDGQALTPTSFGEFDEDSPTIWKPIDVSGLTFGNNGFYLDFEDSDNLGDDESGNSLDFTETNIAAVDQATDTPTNNFCTCNPLDNYFAAMTFSEGNCKTVTTGSKAYVTGTVGLTAGKWYWEVKVATEAAGAFSMVGIADVPATGTTTNFALGYTSTTWCYYAYDGGYRNSNSTTSYGDAYAATSDIIGVYLDLDNNKLYFAKNGTVQNSGTGISITAPASLTSGAYFPATNYWDTGVATYEHNFGGSPAFTVSSAVADANGYGAFEYNPSSGTFDGASKDFLAICTKNLGSDGG